MAFAGKTSGCDVYLIGVVTSGENHIQCCGCLFTPTRVSTPDELPAGLDQFAGYQVYAEPFPEFASKAETATHLESHRLAGHCVPDYVFHRVLASDYLEE